VSKQPDPMHETCNTTAAGRTDLIADISPKDDMVRGNPDFYFQTGARAIELIRAAGVRSPLRILDFACGHGRVLRFLKRDFPEAELTACDLDRGAVDFCAQTFNARTLYSSADPGDVSLDEYDLIWSGSLFTHLDADHFRAFLHLLVEHLSPSGTLVFTANGEAARGFLERRLSNDPDWMERAERYFPVPFEAVAPMLRAYDEQGFAYADYPWWKGFGATLSSRAWVERLAAVSSFREAAWCVWQDVYAIGAR
jgi:SAM-dependent methyltransferase